MLLEAGGPAPPTLELRGMTKRYGDVLACDGVDLDLAPGEIHGILGENGAGKSTLMKIAAGLALPDRGSVRLHGKVVAITDPAHAARLGIGMVHQHYSLVDALTVWENVALGGKGRVDPRATRRKVGEIGARYGLEVDPDAVVRDLPVGLRQRVEIIKCLRHDPRIILLDEPTSVLTPAEADHLFRVLGEGVRREGWAVALVSHRLDEVVRASDRITVMRDGRVVGRVAAAEADAAALARLMVGRDVTLRTGAAAIGSDIGRAPAAGTPAAAAAPVLRVEGARLKAPDGHLLLDGLTLEVEPGEIVGVAGVEGNGQTPLADVLSSLARLDRGRVLVGGVAVPTGRAGAMLRAGVAVIPADRHRSGCVLEMSVADNLVLASPGAYARRGVLRPAAIRDRARALIGEFDIRCPSEETPLSRLSGGNQQRVVLARALSTGPRALVAHQPTRGLDVAAVEYIGGRIQAAARSGIGVLLLSTDVGEIAALADRILVIYRGRIIGEMARGEVDLGRLGLLIGGSAAAEGAA